MSGIRLLALFLVLAAGFGAACGAPRQDEETARDSETGTESTDSDDITNITDINDVLRAHDDELLAIAGVEGVYVGLLDDGETPCIKIMVVEKTRALEEKLPETLQGHPVVVEETGIIRPLGER